MTMVMNTEYVPPVLAAIQKARRALGETSPKHFAGAYLEQLFGKPGSAMHVELFTELATFDQRRGTHFAIAAPRGHAKSTVITLAYVLWCLVYKKEPFIVLVSGTAGQASTLLDHVKRQLETNTKLREDFPELVTDGRIAPWKRDGILLGNGSMLMSCSSGQKLRGVRHGKHRPTLIIADDLEDKQLVASELQRQKVADWFNGTLMKAGTTETNVIVVGTVLHHQSLLATLLDPRMSAGWKGRLYKAVVKPCSRPDLWDRWGDILRTDSEYRGESGLEAAESFYKDHAAAMELGAQVLWPHQYSYKSLMTIRLREGDTTFQAEFQNEPMDPEQCLFARAKMLFWDDRYPTVQALIEKFGRGRFYGACDPSLGVASGKGDYSAIVILFKPPRSDQKYVIAADIARRTPDQTVRRILDYAEMYDFSDFGVEANNFQEVMVENVRRQAKLNRYHIPIHSLTNRGSKLARISALEAEVSQGLLVFNRKDQMLLDQLRHFPVGKHDDGPDALEMAVTMTRRFRGGVSRMCSYTGAITWDSEYGGPPPQGYYGR